MKMSILSDHHTSCVFAEAQGHPMQNGGKIAWMGTCHKDHKGNEHEERELHNIASLSEYIEASLYDILLEGNTAVPYHPCLHLLKWLERNFRYLVYKCSWQS